MEILLKGKQFIEATFGVQQRKDITYRPSNFNYLLELEGNFYCFNTMTRRLAELTQAEAAALASETVCPEEAAKLEPLVEQRFLVPCDADEDKQYLDIYSLADLIEGEKVPGYTMFDILPTTDCNARCFYCFENGVKIQKMSKETADQVIRFVNEKRKPNSEIELSWFGGEPLCEPGMIDYICDEVEKLGIHYHSTIITNGYLWTPELIQKAKNKWKLDRAQFTLDGYGEEHNLRKGFIEDDPNPFERVIRNVHGLLDAGIGVGIRLNMDINNIDSIWEVIYFLEKELDPKQRLAVTPTLLAEKWFTWEDERSAEQKKLLRDTWLAMRDEVERAGLSRPRILSNTLLLKHCMANSGASVTIQPDGSLYTCQTGDSTMFYGNIWDGVTKPDVLKQWSCNTCIRPKCYGCTWLPECTAFSMCAACMSDCKVEMEDGFRRRMIKTIRTAKKKKSAE